MELRRTDKEDSVSVRRSERVERRSGREFEDVVGWGSGTFEGDGGASGVRLPFDLF